MDKDRLMAHSSYKQFISEGNWIQIKSLCAEVGERTNPLVSIPTELGLSVSGRDGEIAPETGAFYFGNVIGENLPEYEVQVGSGSGSGPVGFLKIPFFLHRHVSHPQQLNKSQIKLVGYFFDEKGRDGAMGGIIDLDVRFISVGPGPGPGPGPEGGGSLPITITSFAAMKGPSGEIIAKIPYSFTGMWKRWIFFVFEITQSQFNLFESSMIQRSERIIVARLCHGASRRSCIESPIAGGSGLTAYSSRYVPLALKMSFDSQVRQFILWNDHVSSTTDRQSKLSRNFASTVNLIESKYGLSVDRYQSYLKASQTNQLTSLGAIEKLGPLVANSRNDDYFISLMKVLDFEETQMLLDVREYDLFGVKLNIGGPLQLPPRRVVDTDTVYNSTYCYERAPPPPQVYYIVTMSFICPGANENRPRITPGLKLCLRPSDNSIHSLELHCNVSDFVIATEVVTCECMIPVPSFQTMHKYSKSMGNVPQVVEDTNPLQYFLEVLLPLTWNIRFSFSRAGLNFMRDAVEFVRIGGAGCPSSLIFPYSEFVDDGDDVDGEYNILELKYMPDELPYDEVPSLRSLNAEQIQAVRDILQSYALHSSSTNSSDKGGCSPIPYILHGPPGTGKTLTLVQCIITLRALKAKRWEEEKRGKSGWGRGGKGSGLREKPSESQDLGDGEGGKEEEGEGEGKEDAQHRALLEEKGDNPSPNPNQSLRILVCAPTDAAADVLASRLLASGVSSSEMLRVFWWQVPTKYYNFKPDIAGIAKKQVDEHSEVFDLPNRKEVNSMQIIVTTCNTAGLLRYIGCNPFDIVFVDEASQALECELLCAISQTKAQKGIAVLAGDPLQLCANPCSPLMHVVLQDSMMTRLMKHPLWKSSMYPKKILKRSVLLSDRFPPKLELRFQVMLTKNYRSHSSLLSFPSKMFYDNRLESAADPRLTTRLAGFPLLPIQKDGSYFPMLFFGVDGKHQHGPDSVSLFNQSEAQEVLNLVAQICRFQYPSSNSQAEGIEGSRGVVMETIKPDEIGVICAFRQQVLAVRRLLRSAGFSGASVGAVEDFQGQEKRVIIISTVQSHPLALSKKGRLGLVGNRAKEVNVALTRGAELTVVCGHAPFLYTADPLWSELIEYCDAHDAYLGMGCPQLRRIQAAAGEEAELLDDVFRSALDVDADVDVDKGLIMDYERAFRSYL